MYTIPYGLLWRLGHGGWGMGDEGNIVEEKEGWGMACVLEVVKLYNQCTYKQSVHWI